jgi:hypothetical protein
MPKWRIMHVGAQIKPKEAGRKEDYLTRFKFYPFGVLRRGESGSESKNART